MMNNANCYLISQFAERLASLDINRFTDIVRGYLWCIVVDHVMLLFTAVIITGYVLP